MILISVRVSLWPSSLTAWHLTVPHPAALEVNDEEKDVTFQSATDTEKHKRRARRVSACSVYACGPQLYLIWLEHSVCQRHSEHFLKADVWVLPLPVIRQTCCEVTTSVCGCVCVCAGQKNTLGQVIWVNIPLGWYQIPIPACICWSPCQAGGRSDGTFAPWCTQLWLSPMIQLGTLVNMMESRCVSAYICVCVDILISFRCYFLFRHRLLFQSFTSFLELWMSCNAAICICLVWQISISGSVFGFKPKVDMAWTWSMSFLSSGTLPLWPQKQH